MEEKLLTVVGNRISHILVFLINFKGKRMILEPPENVHIQD